MCTTDQRRSEQAGTPSRGQDAPLGTESEGHARGKRGAECPSWREVVFAIIVRLKKRHQDTQGGHGLEGGPRLAVADSREGCRDARHADLCGTTATHYFALTVVVGRVPARQAATQTINNFFKYRLRREAWQTIKAH